MGNWSYICPRCGKKTKTKYTKDNIKQFANSLYRCEACMDILKINDDLSVSDFSHILKENAKKRKAESKLQERETVGILEDFS